MKITEEQKERILKLDPDFFKVKLEVGKWYKIQNNYRNWLMNYQENRAKCYGFNSLDKYSNDYLMLECSPWVEATEQEVFEALKNEAIKRGFKVGAFFKSIDYDTTEILEIEHLSFCKDNDSIHLRTNSYTYPYRDVYKNGKWAAIIETITKEEAEKNLNKKIV